MKGKTMTRLLACFSLVGLALATSVSSAAPTVNTAQTRDWTVTTIEFDGTTTDSEAFALSTSCSVRAVVYGGSGTASIYQVPTKTTSASSGALVKSFTSVSGAAYSFNPGQRWARATGASDGTVVEVYCSRMIAGSTEKTSCSTVSITESFDTYYPVGGTNDDDIELSYEPDAAGSNTSSTITLSMCSRDAEADSCLAYNYDSDADGLGDTNILDGSSIEKTGLRGVSGFNYLRVQQTGTFAGSPELTICRRRL